MNSLYEISYYWIEQHITLTLSLGVVCIPCVITMYMTLFNTFALHAGLWSSGMTLASDGERSWFETDTILCSISYILLLTLFCTFCSLFHTMANISISLHIEIFIHVKTFIFHSANLFVVAKIELHVKIGDILVLCY